MKALTIWQPWASLIGFTFKEYETRSWCPTEGQLKAGQWLAIHSARGTPAAEINAALAIPEIGGVLRALGITEGNRTQANLPMGVVLAVAQVEGFYRTDTQRHKISLQETMRGNWGPNRWAWKLHNVMRLHRPIQCSGKQGLWTLEYKTRLQVAGQLIADGSIVIKDPSDPAGVLGLLGS